VWKASGLSQAEYCRKNSLRLRGFGYWKIKFKKENLPELIEIQAAIPGVPGVLKLNIGHQFQIEIPDGFSSATLGQILFTLKSL
jgi:hypothetical protein